MALDALVLTPDSPQLTRSIDDYPEGIIIPIDKPYRWTSADVIRKIKFAAIRHFGKRNLKVGHAGTLDPLATGVLLVCIGKATKLAEELQSHDKEYVAGITFGATTPSYDLEKEVDRLFPHDHITKELIEAALPSFIGEQDQIAPLFSAKSIDGVRAYELARKLYKTNGSMDDAAKELIRVSKITISELELMDFEKHPAKRETAESICGIEERTRQGASGRIHIADSSALGLPRALIRMACSKGTYVRAFARDIGEAVGSGAHLDLLQRRRSGIFPVENALSVEQALALMNPAQNTSDINSNS